MARAGFDVLIPQTSLRFADDSFVQELLVPHELRDARRP
jgi:hypothetical protein